MLKRLEKCDGKGFDLEGMTASNMFRSRGVRGGMIGSVCSIGVRRYDRLYVQEWGMEGITIGSMCRNRAWRVLGRGIYVKTGMLRV